LSARELYPQDIGTGLNPVPLSTGTGSTPEAVLDNALWFQGNSPTSGNELYKLGADGSFTFWKDINPGVASSNPHDWAILGS
jgi:ELWxxDGT repeat protein